jgi:phytoene dehydrogenase-like protein
LAVGGVSLAGPGFQPMIKHGSNLKRMLYTIRHFGFGGLLGLIKLGRFISYPVSVMDRFTAGRPPRPLEELMAEAPSDDAREQLRVAYTGSAMDLIDRFLPDKKKHGAIRAVLAFAAVQSTYKGPYDKGSALCLVYTLATTGNRHMCRVKGGLGMLSEALTASYQEKGGEIRLKTAVKSILLDKGKVLGVELKNGEQIHAKVVLSNLDKPATYLRLLGEEHLPESFVENVRGIEQQGAYMHMLFKLKGLPSYGGEWAWMNKDVNNLFGGSMVVSPEQMQESYETCKRGELPERMPVAFQIPTIPDPSLAPVGVHLASAYGFYFPCEAAKEARGKLRDAAAEKIIEEICRYMPDFADLIVEKAVFSSDHFATMHGATNGDFTHGLIHPDQMLWERAGSDGSAHKTPIENLFLCGSACHPGPGVTFLPGYNCGNEVYATVFSGQQSQVIKDAAELLESAKHAA